MPDIILNCPNCKEEVAKYIPKLECFQISYDPDPQKLGDQSCKLPIKTICARCMKPKIITDPVTKVTKCECAKSSAVFTIRPYPVDKQYGEWASLHLPGILRSFYCADAVVKCPTSSCASYMHLTEFMKTGKMLSEQERNAPQMDFRDGKFVIFGVDEMPPK